MTNNKYDEKHFFEQYAQMPRSQFGLQAAGEWPSLKALMPNLQDQTMLDLGCGYGWHCRWAVEHGAREVIGVDLSHRMIEKAKEINNHPKIHYQTQAIESFTTDKTFDLILSSLALHYIEDYQGLIQKLKPKLNTKGTLLFSVEHPIFTAEGSQTWVTDSNGIPQHWPVDRYYDESWRSSVFLGEHVIKYHRTMTHYINTLIQEGFVIDAVTEVIPPEDWVKEDIRNADELRRPMMLILKAHRK